MVVKQRLCAVAAAVFATAGLVTSVGTAVTARPHSHPVGIQTIPTATAADATR